MYHKYSIFIAWVVVVFLLSIFNKYKIETILAFQSKTYQRVMLAIFNLSYYFGIYIYTLYTFLNTLIFV
ncbi:hypothetical protein CUC43_14710 [Bacillus thuringiensis LM1212]|nr:hypothetical protein CUC43_14710 [Bacillus thuringiensis LM1212]OTY49901.1 hypothetical protein BK748_26775 [Bacillus thuringiensis serovar graciosensis]PEU98536.1 hypothetical protein CN415_00200 [Bacillus cereus]